MAPSTTPLVTTTAELPRASSVAQISTTVAAKAPDVTKASTLAVKATTSTTTACMVGGPIRLSRLLTKCLRIGNEKGHHGGNGSPLVIWDCLGDKAERFSVPASGVGPIRWSADPEKCLAAAADNRIALADCKKGDAEQIFKLPAHDSGQIQWQKMPEMCLDLKGGSTLDGTNILLWRCKGKKANQQWDLAFLAEGRVSTACAVATTPIPASRASTSQLQENHDCKEDYVNRALLWSDAKSRWCCEKKQVGCAGESAAGWTPFSASQRSTLAVERKALRMTRHSNSSSSSQIKGDGSYWPLSSKFLLWQLPHMGQWPQATTLSLLAGFGMVSVAMLAVVVAGRCRPFPASTLDARTRSFCLTARRPATYRPVSSSEAGPRRGLLSPSASSGNLETL